VYGVEMTEEGHYELGEVLNACRAKIVISGYPSVLYEDMFKTWRRVEFDIANHAAGGRTKARKRETLWVNW
jgi:DNA adenine methylase